MKRDAVRTTPEYVFWCKLANTADGLTPRLVPNLTLLDSGWQLDHPHYAPKHLYATPMNVFHLTAGINSLAKFQILLPLLDTSTQQGTTFQIPPIHPYP